MDKRQQTSISGVNAAGYYYSGSQLVVAAAAEGATAAIHIHRSLIPDDRRTW